MANRALTQTELLSRLEEVAEEGQSKKQIKDVLDSLTYVTQEAIKNGEKVRLGGIVTVGVRVAKATKKRMGRNPATGEAVPIAAKPARAVIQVRVDKALKESVPSVAKARAAARR